MLGECHAHIFMNGINYQKAVRDNKPFVDTAHIHRCFEAYQKAGITFIRDGGDALGVSLAAKKIASDYGIDYRTPIFAIHLNGHYGGIVGKGFSDMDEYLELVEEAIDQGADFIKIMVSGIMDFNQYRKLSENGLPDDIITEMVDIAHDEGMSVMVHANGAKAALSAIQSGAESIEHGNYIDQKCITAMSENGTLWIPTLSPTGNLLGDERFPEKEVLSILESANSNISKAYKQNVTICCGSDAGAYRVPHAQGTLDELKYLENALGSCCEDVEKYLEDSEKKLRQLF